jgi:hypothetical protein
MSPYQRDMIRFKRFIEMTLDSFERNWPSSARELDGKRQYSEGALRRFVDGALDSEVIEQFGKIPGAD